LRSEVEENVLVLEFELAYTRTLLGLGLGAKRLDINLGVVGLVIGQGLQEFGDLAGQIELPYDRVTLSILIDDVETLIEEPFPELDRFGPRRGGRCSLRLRQIFAERRSGAKQLELAQHKL